jgi:hypothetical protein
MKRFLTRASVAGLSAALVAGVALVAAPAASAAQIGTLTFSGLTSQSSPFTMTTSGACPAAATNFLIRMSNFSTGSGNLPEPPTSPNLTGNTAGSTIAGGINSGAFTATAATTLGNFAVDNGLASLGAGTYRVELVCRTSLSSTSLGEFTGVVTVAAGGVPSGAPLLQNVTTTTSVVAAPASISNIQTSTFTASVSPAAAVGTVQFKVDGVNFGAPVTVSGGTAVSGLYTPSSAGTKVVTAVYSGGSDSSSQYGTSTGTTNLVVSQATAATTTNLALSSATVAYPGTVTATATVSGAVTINAGTVQFQVDGTNVGSPVAVNGSGVAVSAPISRAAGGPYAVTAIFSGATISGVAYGTSTSSSASFNVTAAQYAPDEQNVKVTLPPGTLVIATPYSCATVACDAVGDNPLDLGNFTLNSTATEYSASGLFTGITVTDTRPGNLPWTVSAIASDLAKVGVASPNNNEKINGQNVGLNVNTLVSTNATPVTFLGALAPGSSTAGQNFTGFNNVAASHVQASDVGTLGLGGTPKVILHANTGLGSTVTSGVLTIVAPTNTLDGTYTGTVTFTIIGS